MEELKGMPDKSQEPELNKIKFFKLRSVVPLIVTHLHTYINDTTTDANVYVMRYLFVPPPPKKKILT
jgi:hypothetical protein